MCFIKKVSLQENEYRKITEVLNKNLIVFKIINKTITRSPFIIKRVSYYAPFYFYKYKKKKVNISPLDIAIRKEANDIIINVTKGFHSFRTLNNLINSSIWIDFYLWQKPFTIAKFIIPKSSIIVYNDSEIVSNQIIFIEELK